MAQVLYKKCNTCNDNEGSLYCYECKEFLCETCKKFHDKFTKGHCLKDSKHVDKTVLDAEVTCKQHSQEHSYYCESCQCLICDKCALDNHKQHEFCKIDEKSKITRDNLQTISVDIDLKSEKVMKKIKELEAYKNDVMPERKLTQQEAAKDISKELMDIIESVTQQGLDEIENTFETEVNRVEYTLQELESKKETFQRMKNEVIQKLKIQHNSTFLAIQNKDQLVIDGVPESTDFDSSDEENFNDFDKHQFVRQFTETVKTRYSIRSRPPRRSYRGRFYNGRRLSMRESSKAKEVPEQTL